MSEYRVYRVFYSLLAFFYRLLYRVKVTGRENIPEGAAVVCGNHSNMFDFLLVAMAFTGKHHLHFMAKIELLNIPVIGWVIRKAGSFGVDRSKSDINAVKTCMKYLKSGEKVGIFPEGTRVDSAGDVEAKRGAVVFASRCAAPLVPVYIPRVKKMFRRIDVVIGEPYELKLPRGAGNEEYQAATNELMNRIEELGVQNEA